MNDELYELLLGMAQQDYDGNFGRINREPVASPGVNTRWIPPTSDRVSNLDDIQMNAALNMVPPEVAGVVASNYGPQNRQMDALYEALSNSSKFGPQINSQPFSPPPRPMPPDNSQMPWGAPQSLGGSEQQIPMKWGQEPGGNPPPQEPDSMKNKPLSPEDVENIYKQKEPIPQFNTMAYQYWR